MWEYIQPIFALLVLIVVIRYILLGKYTTEEISTYIKETFSRIIILLLAALLAWFLYSAFKSDYESDVCGFITSDNCM